MCILFAARPSILGPVYIVVTAATLPILAECQERGAPWTECPQATSDTAMCQNQRVLSGCGENCPLVRRSAQPYFQIRFSRFSCHRAIFARNAAREDYVNRASVWRVLRQPARAERQQKLLAVLAQTIL